MPNYSNILDLIGEGIRESNPIYRAKQQKLQEQQARMAEITQQQLFQAGQHANDRSTLTEFEKQQLAQQDAVHTQAIKEHYEGAVSGGKAIFTDADGNPTDSDLAAPQSPAQKAVGVPAATGPADAATNGMGGAGGNGPQGALTPTSATASAAPTGGIGDSGGGPSAPPIWKNPFDDILPQGPLTGAPGGTPAGNTSANTQQSRASSAQAGPLAQINQGSVTPSETASGQTGMDSGAQPSASAGSVAVRKPDVKLPDGRYVRFLTPQEQDTVAQKQARANAAATRQTQTEQVRQLLQIPEVAARAKADPNFAADLYTHAGAGYVPPAITSSQQQANLMSQLDDANKNGNTARADQLRTEIMAARPGAQQATLSPPALAAAAKRYVFTGEMPAGMGRNGIMSSEIQDAAARLYPNEDVSKNKSFYAANKKTMAAQIPVFDAIDQYERTAKDNIDNSLPLLKKVVDSGVPWINQPLRAINAKALGDTDIPAYNAAAQINSNEIARILSMASANPGVLSDASRNEARDLISAKSATPAQLLKTYKVLRTDMQNRRAEAGQQIQNIGSRTGASMNDLHQWFGPDEEAPTPGTSDVRNTPNGAPPAPVKSKVADTATLRKYVSAAGGDKVKARQNLLKDNYTIQ